MVWRRPGALSTGSTTTITWPNFLRWVTKTSWLPTLRSSLTLPRIVPGAPREIFARYGYAPLPPSELDERQLAGRLWEWLYAAAARRFFFCSTDHLSDRELYTLLWERWLDELTVDIPPDAQTNTTTIIAEFNAGGMTHEEIYLRYYADEGDQALWRSSDPGLVFPPHEDPPLTVPLSPCTADSARSPRRLAAGRRRSAGRRRTRSARP